MRAKPDRSELNVYVPAPDLKDEFWSRVKLPIAKRRNRHHLWKVIHDVAETKNLWRFAQILNDPDMKQISSRAGIALSAAADVGGLNMVKHVLSHAGPFEIQYVQSAMRSAVRHDDVAMLRVLLDHTGEQAAKPDHLWMDILRSSVHARSGFITEMITRGHMPHTAIIENLLTGMILHQDSKAVDLLLSEKDYLPTLEQLSKAVEKGHPKIVQSLVNAGADCQKFAENIRIENRVMYLRSSDHGERAFSLRKSTDLRKSLHHIKKQIQKENYAIENHEMTQILMDVSVDDARKNQGALLVDIALSGQLTPWMRHRATKGEFLNHKDFYVVDPKTHMHITAILGYKKQLPELFQAQNWVHNVAEMAQTYDQGILLQHRDHVTREQFQECQTLADKRTVENQNREKIKKISGDSIKIKRRPK